MKLRPGGTRSEDMPYCTLNRRWANSLRETFAWGTQKQAVTMPAPNAIPNARSIGSGMSNSQTSAAVTIPQSTANILYLVPESAC